MAVAKKATPTGKLFSATASLILLLTLLAGAAPEAAANEPAFLMGQATRVIDGRTLEVGGIPVRVEGVYTARPGELYGHTAKVYTERLVENLDLRCELMGAADEGYPLARCIAGGRPLAALIIQEGAALDCPSQSKGRYAELESARARELLSLPESCR